MFGMIALESLAAAVTLIELAPGGHEGGPCAHILDRRAAPARGEGEPRITGFIQQTAGADSLELLRDEVEGLVPGDRHEAGVMLAPLLRIGPLHGLLHAMGIVGLLDQPVGLDADTPSGRVGRRARVIRFDARGDVILHLHPQKIGSSHALVAVHRHHLAFTDPAFLYRAHRLVMPWYSMIAYRS